MGTRHGRRAAFGDYQTPLPLSRSVCQALRARGIRPRTIIEPTCGEGSFLVAACEAFGGAQLVGRDVQEHYVSAARARLREAGGCGDIARADFFATDWRKELARRPGPFLVLGNPPWVTSADLAVLGIDNAPARTNLKGDRGLDARTGKSNFDISEWMLIALLEALQGVDARVAMLVKSSVARRVVQHAERQRLGLSDVSFHRIDARAHFGAAVDAGLFCFSTADRGVAECRVYADLSTESPERTLGVRGGVLVADVDAHDAAGDLVCGSGAAWRSGIKHDCARVMELRESPGGLCNGYGRSVDIEHDYVFPLLKSSDLARQRSVVRRHVIVTQASLGDDTGGIQRRAPRTWRYLTEHAARLDARKSAIYRGRARFAMFGVGDYSYSAWKVAVSGLYKEAVFGLVGPHDGKPVMFDDTCYFLAFDGPEAARAAHRVLSGAAARQVIRAFAFWDAKRPITKELLSRLDLARLAAAERQAGKLSRAEAGLLCDHVAAARGRAAPG